MLLDKRLYHTHTPCFPLEKEQVSAIKKFEQALQEKVLDTEDVTCLCGASHSTLIANYDRYSIECKTNLCKSCGMLWTSPRLDKKSLALFYKSYYREIYVGKPFANEDFFSEQISHGHEIYRFISPAIRGNNLLVIDIGCGAGGTLIPFKERNWRVVGYDVGEKYLQHGISQGLTLESDSLESLHKYEGADLILLSHVLEHFSNPSESLAEIANLLNEDGYLYIELPGIFHIHRTYGSTLMFLQNAHLYHFTLSSLTKLLSESGFRLIKGDNYIHALFQKDSSYKKLPTKNQYSQVLLYLYLTEILRRFKILYIAKRVKEITHNLFSH